MKHLSFLLLVAVVGCKQQALNPILSSKPEYQGHVRLHSIIDAEAIDQKGDWGHFNDLVVDPNTPGELKVYISEEKGGLYVVVATFKPDEVTK